MYIVEWVNENEVECARVFEDYSYALGFVERLEKRGIFAYLGEI